MLRKDASDEMRAAGRRFGSRQMQAKRCALIGWRELDHSHQDRILVIGKVAGHLIRPTGLTTQKNAASLAALLPTPGERSGDFD